MNYEPRLVFPPGYPVFCAKKAAPRLPFFEEKSMKKILNNKSNVLLCLYNIGNL